MPLLATIRSIGAATLATLVATSPPPARADEWSACVAQLRADAPRHRVSAADFDRLTANVRFLERVVSSRASQAEVVDPWWDYVPRAVDDERTREGRELVARWSAQMGEIEARFGVDRTVFTAIWGVETNYGATRGSLPLLDVWVTRACTERRPLWRANVYASLRLLRDGRVEPDEFVGSWGGAFGLTQFIPTSYEALGADGDGDGRIDLMHSVPDALASTANHLAGRSRWLRGVPAAIEVRVPPALTSGAPGVAERWRREDMRSLAQWRAAGVVPAGDRGGLPDEVRASLFFPAGGAGPAFLVTGNFDALLGYNNSTKYALSVALLATRIAGAERAPLAPWPTDDPGLDRAGVRALQELLAGRGHDVGTPDGIPGPRTRDAVRAEQRRLGWPEDGRAGERILRALRSS